jgi:hypothetical protein
LFSTHLVCGTSKGHSAQGAHTVWHVWMAHIFCAKVRAGLQFAAELCGLAPSWCGQQGKGHIAQDVVVSVIHLDCTSSAMTASRALLGVSLCAWRGHLYAALVPALL